MRGQEGREEEGRRKNGDEQTLHDKRKHRQEQR